MAFDQAPALVAELPLALFIGQSYFNTNNNNGRVLDEAADPDALMLDGVNGLMGGGTRSEVTGACYGGLAPASDPWDEVQSTVAPFLHRHARRARELGLPPGCVGHSEAMGGASIRHLLPAVHPEHMAAPIYRNAMIAVSAYAMHAHGRGARPGVPVILFCQGTGDRGLPKQEYRRLMDDLFAALSRDVAGITGQAARPEFLIVQPPALLQGGRWPCLQAQVDICRERADCHLAVSGWAVPQHDRTHFSAEGAVMVGEACAEAYLGLRTGRDMTSPVILSAARADRVIRAEASHDLVHDAGEDTPRHRLFGKPLAHWGLQVDRGEIESVAIEGRRIEVVLAPGPETPTTLWHAHTSREDLNPKAWKRRENQSVNRGNIRAAEGMESLFLGRPIHRWLASSAHELRVA